MTATLTDSVWALKLPANKQLVLLAMADCADSDGSNVSPSVGIIAWKTGYSERQVRRLIASLVSDGILVLTDAPAGGTKHYRINSAAGKQKPEYVAKSHNTPVKMATPKHVSPDIAMSPPTPDKLTGEGGHSYVTPTPDIAMSPPSRVYKDSSIQESIEKTQESRARSSTPKPSTASVPFADDTPAKQDYADVPYDTRYGIIQAWCSNLAAQPVQAFSEKHVKGRQNHDTAAALHRAGYTEAQVAVFVRAKRNDSFWKGKTLTLQKVAELLPEWTAKQTAPAPLRVLPSYALIQDIPGELDEWARAPLGVNHA